MRNEVYWIFALIAMLCVTSAHGLEPIADTITDIEQADLKDRRLIQQGNVSPLWLEDGSRFLFSKNGQGDLTVFLADPEANTVQKLTSDQEVRSALGVDQYQDEIRLEGFEESKGLLLIRVGETIHQYDPNAKTSRPLPENSLEKSQQISDQFPTTFGPLVEARSPDGKFYVTVKDHNLYLRADGAKDLRPLTTDGHLKETWLNTQESSMGFNVFWSPDSSRIATLQLDARSLARTGAALA